MTFTVGEKHGGVRLSSYLLGTCRVPGTLLPRLKREGRILVNGTPTHVNYTLHSGDVVTLRIEDETQSAIPQPWVLWEDGDVLVLDKPAGMPTHPSAHHTEDSVATAVSRYTDRVFRPVSRLDTDTTGVLLTAKNEYAAAALCRAMQEGGIRKTYLAVTVGVPDGEGHVAFYSRPKPGAPSVREICEAGDVDAVRNETAYRVLQTGTLPGDDPASPPLPVALVLCRPLTGRTHQLRLTFAAVGHPLVGDLVYGAPSSVIARQALHAARVTFPHPATGTPVTVASPLPGDFAALLARAGIAFDLAHLPDER